MRLTDISLNWLLPGAVLLVGVLAAVAVLARGKRAGDKAAADDSLGAQRGAPQAQGGRLRHRLLRAAVLLRRGRRRALLPRTGRLRPSRTSASPAAGSTSSRSASTARRCSAPCSRCARPATVTRRSARGMLVWTFAGAAAWFNWVHAPRGHRPRGRPAVLRRDVAVGRGALRPRAEADPPGRAARTGPGAPSAAADPDRTVAARTPGDLRRLVADAARGRTHAGRGGRRGPRGPAGEGAEPAPPAGPGEAGPGAHQGAQPAAPGLAGRPAAARQVGRTGHRPGGGLRTGPPRSLPYRSRDSCPCAPDPPCRP